MKAIPANCKHSVKRGAVANCIKKNVTGEAGIWLRKPYVASKVHVTGCMDANMSQNTKIEVLEKLRWRYASAGLEHKRKLLDEAVQLLGYHRKSAIRALRPKAAPL